MRPQEDLCTAFETRLIDYEPLAYYRPYVLPPGIPKERADTLRKAFQETLKDPEFLTDARKAKLDIKPITGEDMENKVNKLFKLNPSLVAKLKGRPRG